jgi:hypothetical protein
LSDTITALIRTWVPIGVGSFAAWLVTLGVEFSEAAEAGLIVGVTGLLIGAYYTAVTYLAKKWPGLQILLGAKTAPVYPPS